MWREKVTILAFSAPSSLGGLGTSLRKRMAIIKSVVIFVVITGYFTNGANILGLMPIASPSHHIWNSLLTHALAERGHNLTILSVDIPKNPKDAPKNAHYIHLEETYAHMYKNADETLNISDYIGTGVFQDIPMFYDFGIKIWGGIAESKGLQTLLNYPDDFKFDLVIHDYSLGPLLLGFLHKFNNPPSIGVSAFHHPPNTFDNIGGHIYPAYVPFHSTVYDIDMTFFQRLENTALYVADMIYRKWIYTPQLDKEVRKFFGDDMPYLGDLEERTVIALVNSHPAVNYPEPLPPNVIEVGGMQVVDPKPLPAELESFMNASKEGGILVSLGTNMHSEDIGPTKCQIFLDTMASLPEYNFFWKIEFNSFKLEIPKNVLIKPFYPQRDLLAHPRLKAFVTHAGGLSTQEATWRGVPMIGIPLFVDQHRNLQKSILAGVAEKVNYLTLTEDSLRSTIVKVLKDKGYAERMKIRAARFRDRPMKPLETAIWWVEYVLRHPNPDHLRSPVLKIGLIRGNSLDVVLFVFAILVVFFVIVLKIVKCLFCRSKQNKKVVINVDKKRK